MTYECFSMNTRSMDVFLRTVSAGMTLAHMQKCSVLHLFLNVGADLALVSCRVQYVFRLSTGAKKSYEAKASLACP